MDLAQATNAAETITFGGKPFPVRQLKLHEWGTLQAWLKQSLANPLARAIKTLAELKAGGTPVDPELRDATLAAATLASKSWPPRVGSKFWLVALDEAEGGGTQFIHTALNAGGTVLSMDEAEALDRTATPDEFAELVRVTYLGEPPVPKAAAPSTPSSTPTPTLIEISRAKTARMNGGRSSTGSPRRGSGPTGKSAS